jgi:hypothetical protein
MRRTIVVAWLTSVLLWQGWGCSAGSDAELEIDPAQSRVDQAMCGKAQTLACADPEADCDQAQLAIARQGCETALTPLIALAASLGIEVGVAGGLTLAGLKALLVAAAPAVLVVAMVALTAYVIYWYATHWEQAKAELLPLIGKNALLNVHPLVAASYLLYQLVSGHWPLAMTVLAQALPEVAYELRLLGDRTAGDLEEAINNLDLFPPPNPGPGQIGTAAVVTGLIVFLGTRLVSMLRQPEPQPQFDEMGRVYTRELNQVEPWFGPLQHIPSDPAEPRCISKIRNELMTPNCTQLARKYGLSNFFIACKDDDHPDLFLTPGRAFVSHYFVEDPEPGRNSLPPDEAMDRLLTGEPLTRQAQVYICNLSQHTRIDLQVLRQQVMLQGMDEYHQELPPESQFISILPWDGLDDTIVWFNTNEPYTRQSPEWDLRFSVDTGGYAFAYLNWSRGYVIDDNF